MITGGWMFGGVYLLSTVAYETPIMGGMLAEDIQTWGGTIAMAVTIGRTILCYLTEGTFGKALHITKYACVSL